MVASPTKQDVPACASYNCAINFARCHVFRTSNRVCFWSAARKLSWRQRLRGGRRTRWCTVALRYDRSLPTRRSPSQFLTLVIRGSEKRTLVAKDESTSSNGWTALIFFTVNLSCGVGCDSDCGSLGAGYTVCTELLVWRERRYRYVGAETLISSVAVGFAPAFLFALALMGMSPLG